MKRAVTIALSMLLFGANAALAQVKPVDPPQPRPPAVDPKACAPGDRLKPSDINPSAPSGTTGESLSDKLARTDGVICPPNVDPEIRAPTPGGGKTPVIPPPGSPGGDQNVRPK
jgi:hypothetical protein